MSSSLPQPVGPLPLRSGSHAIEVASQLEAAVEHGLRIENELALKVLRDRIAAAEADRSHVRGEIEQLHLEHASQSQARAVQLEEIRQQAAERERQLSAQISHLHAVHAEAASRLDHFQRLDSGFAAAVARKLRSARHRLAPPGSRRDRVAGITARGLRSLWRNGPIETVRRGAGKAWRKLRPITSAAPVAPAIAQATPVIVTERAPEPPRPSAPKFIPPIDPTYLEWIKNNEPGEAELKEQVLLSKQFPLQPLISVLTPVYNTPPDMLELTIRSLLAQTYENWELVLADGGSTRAATRETLLKFGRSDGRVRVLFLEENGGISRNSNHALSIARGEYVALLDHDDTIAPFAMYEIVRQINADPKTDFIYSDKDMQSEDGQHRFWPYFKPAWSPELLLTVNYLTHFCIARTSIARAIGGFDPSTDGSQDWDIFLRIVERTENIAHIPKILYHWRLWSNSVASGIAAKPYCLDTQVTAVSRHFERTGAAMKPAQNIQMLMLEPRRSLTTRQRVSIIVSSTGSSCSAGAWIEWLAANDCGHDIELVFAHRGPIPATLRDYFDSLDPEGDVRAVYDQFATRPAIQNQAASAASGTYLVFLEDGLLPCDPSAIENLILWFERTGVEGAGGVVVLPDETIAHGPILLATPQAATSTFVGAREQDATANGQFRWCRNVSAVGSACLAARREYFLARGGFSPDYAHSGGDVQFCLESTAATKARFVFTAAARFRTCSQQPLFSLVGQDRQRIHEIVQRTVGDFDPMLSRFMNSVTGGRPQIESNGRHAYIPPATDPETLSTEKILSRKSPAGTTATPAFLNTQALVNKWSASPRQIEASRRLVDAFPSRIRIRSVNWFLPGNFSTAFFGGIHTILRLAQHLHLQHGVENRFCFITAETTSRARDRIVAAFPGLASSQFLNACEEGDIMDLPASDAAVATFWTTAYQVLKFNRTKRKFHMLQDFEPLFYEAGSTSGLVEASYRFGFHGLCNTVSLQKAYEEEFGGTATHFVPAVDTQFFAPPSTERCSDEPHRVLFYARPGVIRNGFELGLAALKTLKQRMGDDVQILAAGEEWAPADFGLDGIVHNLGLLSIEETAALYRDCDLGVSLMFTRHPSYLPFELMASGCPVLTNINPATSWLFKDEANCFLSEASAECLSNRMEQALNNRDLRRSVAKAALEQVQQFHGDWAAELEHLFQFMCDTSVRRSVTGEVHSALAQRHAA